MLGKEIIKRIRRQTIEVRARAKAEARVKRRQKVKNKIKRKENMEKAEVVQ